MCLLLQPLHTSQDFNLPHLNSLTIKVNNGIVVARQHSLFIRGSTLDATIKLLCAAVRGIIQRKDQFVLKLQVEDEQVSRLVEVEDIAKDKCAVTRTEREEDGRLYPVQELKPHCE